MTEVNDQTESGTAESVESTDSGNISNGQIYKPLRTWPPILFVIGLVASRFLTLLFEDLSIFIMMVGIFGPIVFGVLLLLWWSFASRATGKERIVGILCVIAIAAITFAIIDKSMIGPGMMRTTVPMGLGLFGLTAILCANILSFKRTVIILLVTMFGFGFSSLLRSEGMWGNFELGLHWRWVPSAEDLLLAGQDGKSNIELSKKRISEFDGYLKNPEWPAFRGNLRNGIQEGIALATDWNQDVSSPLWKIPVGPGWSSFSVAGEMLFTQEQRGEMETIVCYDSKSGNEIWTQQINSRFSDPLGGPGPRATPTIAKGQLFVMGGNGHLISLDPKTGDIVWKKDIRKVADREPPGWGFSSSPLVVKSLVIVHAGGKDDKGTLAFDIKTGELKWSASAGDHSYSSPNLITVAGEKVVAMLTNKELNLLNPADGKVLLNYPCESMGHRVVQPQVVEEDYILIGDAAGEGTVKLHITKKDDQWLAESVWSSRYLKPDFNDFVIYQGHLYGFDGMIFTCISLEDGKRKWKRGRYGKGQVLLLEEAGQLLVLSEEGDVVLLKADPSAHTELAKFHAIDGKTWNHPVIIGDRLYVRNSEQAAAFRLPLAN